MIRILKCEKIRITQGYHSKHHAVDMVKYFAMVCPVIAHSDGIVLKAITGCQNNKGSTGTASYGNFVHIAHKNGYSTLYAHLSAVYVKPGEKVSAGQVIGYMGNTGNSYGAHLHFEVRKGNVRINPIPYIEADLPLQITHKSNQEIAKEVLQGKWGNGAIRKERLTAAGYNFYDVQSIVNELVNKPVVPSKPALKDTHTIALEVIRGLWGNGSLRREKLTAAGYNYREVQNEVNKILR